MANEIKFAKQTPEEIMSHYDHSLKVDYGPLNKRQNEYQYGIWCNDCQEPVGIYAQKKTM